MQIYRIQTTFFSFTKDFAISEPKLSSFVLAPVNNSESALAKGQNTRSRLLEKIDRVQFEEN